MLQQTENLPCIPHSHKGDSFPSSFPGSLINRRFEKPAAYLRPDRYFTVGHEWYINKREGGYLGQFLAKERAELAPAKHIAFLFVVDDRFGNAPENNQGRPPTEFERLAQEVLMRWRQPWMKSGKNQPDAQGKAQTLWLGMKDELDCSSRPIEF